MSSISNDPPGRAGTSETNGGGLTPAEVAVSPEFLDLKRRFKSFIFPMTALFLVWYFLYVLLAAFAPAFMGTKVFGNINIGLLLGLGQFVSTFAITMIYRRWADKKFDPAAEHLRHSIEGALR